MLSHQVAEGVGIQKEYHRLFSVPSPPNTPCVRTGNLPRSIACSNSSTSCGLSCGKSRITLRISVGKPDCSSPRKGSIDTLSACPSEYGRGSSSSIIFPLATPLYVIVIPFKGALEIFRAHEPGLPRYYYTICCRSLQSRAG